MPIREKIKISDKDMNLKITFSGLENVCGEEDGVLNFVNKVSNDSINPVYDQEIISFLYDQEKNGDFIMEFYHETFGWGNLFINAGFTSDEVTKYTMNLRNSFFILDFFDDFSSNNRRKIFTKYYTIINRLGIQEEYEGRVVPIKNTEQLKRIEVPRYYLNNNNSFLFLRVLFYNAKTGAVIPFYNEKKSDEKGDEKLFFKINLDVSNRIWFVESEVSDDLHGKEITVESNPAYRKKIEKTNKNLRLQRIEYPEKQYFDYKTGTYLDAE